MTTTHIIAAFLLGCAAGIHAQLQETPGSCTCSGRLANISVCGTDGFDYINICVLKESQKTDPTLGRRCMGKCPCNKTASDVCSRKSSASKYTAADFAGGKSAEAIVNMIGVEHAAYGEEHLQRCLFSQMGGGGGGGGRPFSGGGGGRPFSGGSDGRPGRPARPTRRPTTIPSLPQPPVPPANGGGQTGGGSGQTGAGNGNGQNGGGNGNGQNGGGTGSGAGSGVSGNGGSGGQTGGAGGGQVINGGATGGQVAGGETGGSSQSGNGGAAGGEGANGEPKPIVPFSANEADGSGKDVAGSSSFSSSSSSSSSSGGSTVNSESSGNSNPAPNGGSGSSRPARPLGQHGKPGRKPGKGRRTSAPPPDTPICMTNGQTMPSMKQANCALETSSDSSLGVRCLGTCAVCKDQPICPTEE